MPSALPELDPLDEVSFNNVFAWILVSCRNGSRKAQVDCHPLSNELKTIIDACILSENEVPAEQCRKVGRFIKKTEIIVKNACIEFLLYVDVVVRDSLVYYSDLKKTFFLSLLNGLQDHDGFCFEKFSQLCRKLELSVSNAGIWEFYRLLTEAYLNFRILGQFRREQVANASSDSTLRQDLAQYDSLRSPGYSDMNSLGYIRKAPRPTYNVEQIVELPPKAMKLELMSIVYLCIDESSAKAKLDALFIKKGLLTIISKYGEIVPRNRNKSYYVDKVYSLLQSGIENV